MSEFQKSLKKFAIMDLIVLGKNSLKANSIAGEDLEQISKKIMS